jgi:TonB family protein
MSDWLFDAAPWLDAIGWGLLHSLWQGMLLALLYACLRKTLQRAPAQLRVVLGEAALLACVLLPAISVWSVSSAAGAAAVGSAVLSDLGWPAQRAVEAGRELPLTALLATAWALGVGFLALRAGFRWRRLRRIVEQAQPVCDDWQRRLVQLCQRHALQVPVRWLESAEVAAPILVGWLRPVILFPLGMTVGLPPRQIELLLAHELAHVRRADFLFNLLQLLVETLLFFNPCVRWLSAQVRHERELACDERVAADPRDRGAYARALLAVAEHRLHHGEMALAATGGVLLDRVRRIVGETEPEGRAGGLRALMVALLLAAVLVLGVRAVQPSLQAIALPPVERLLGESLRAVGIEPLPPGPVAIQRPRLAAPLQASTQTAAPPAPLPVAGLRRTASTAGEALAEPLQALVDTRPVLQIDPPARADAEADADADAVDAALAPLAYRAPGYPRAARLAGVEGWVELEFRIADDGRVEDMRVLAAEPAGAFEAAARSALRGWRFPPAAAGQQRYQRFDFSLGAAAPAGLDNDGCNRPATGSRVCRRGPLLEDSSVSSFSGAALRR